MKKFLAKKRMEQIENPPYSPDLNPSFLFPWIKLALKGKVFYDIPDIQRKVSSPFVSVPNEDFLQSFQDMYIR
ncbi:hypothetical protein TNCV_3399411 [Trichonephila clavipes]|nr:hypothetical protein TNCV_3399411 [Trichonephila clavipes]